MMKPWKKKQLILLFRAHEFPLKDIMEILRSQDHISEYMYRCTNEILYGLGKMYGGGGEFTKNIDG